MASLVSGTNASSNESAIANAAKAAAEAAAKAAAEAAAKAAAEAAAKAAAEAAAKASAQATPQIAVKTTAASTPAVTPATYKSGFDLPQAEPVALTVPQTPQTAPTAENVTVAEGDVPTHIPKTPYDMGELTLANTQYGYFANPMGTPSRSPSANAGPDAAIAYLLGHSGSFTYQSVFVGNLAVNGQAEATLGQAWNKPENHDIILQGVNASREATQGGASGITDAQIKGWATGNGKYATQWAQIARQLEPPIEVYSKSEQSAASTQVATAKAAYTTAQKQTATLDDNLNKELARIGPGLTDQQRQAYIDRYKTDHGPEYAAEETTAAAYAGALADPAFRFAAQSDPAQAKKLYEGYQALASSPSQGKAALEWAGQTAKVLSEDPNSPEAKAMLAGMGAQNASELLTRLGNEVVQPAMGSTYAQLCAQTDPDSAFEQLGELVEPFKNVKEICKSPTEIKEAFDQGRKIAQAAANGTLTEAQLAELGEKYEKMSPLQRGFAAVTVAYGAYGAAKSGRDGDYGEMLKGALSTTKSGLELGAGAIEVVAKTGKLAAAIGEEGAATAVGLAATGAKLAPVLGALVNGISFVQDVQGAAKDKSAGLVISAVGDAIGVLGIIPGGGEVFAAIGTGISAIGHLIDYNQKQGVQFNEEKKILGELANDKTLDLHLDPKLAEIYSGKDVQTGRLAEVGMTPEQIQAYALAHPDVMDFNTTGLLVDSAKALGITNGDDFLTFVDRVSRQHAQPGQAPNLMGEVERLQELWVQSTPTSPWPTESKQQTFQRLFKQYFPDVQNFVAQFEADPRAAER